MAKRHKIVAASGAVLGEFEAPDDATPEAIEAYNDECVAKIEAEGEEKRGREKRRVTAPRVGKVKCSGCGELLERGKVFDTHVYEEGKRLGYLSEADGPENADVGK